MQCPYRNNFCYLCGYLYTPSKYLHNISKNFEEDFEGFFILLCFMCRIYDAESYVQLLLSCYARIETRK